jgi:outer membrane immunogenic protein
MKRILLAGAAAAFLGLSGPATAADYPVKGPIAGPALFDWSGFYLGVNGGWAHANLRWQWITVPAVNENRSSDSWVIGGHIGYQKQFGSLVLGVEANVLTGDFETSPICAVNPAFRCGSDVRWLWTIGPRAGVAFNNFLVFVTGGFAQGSLRTEAITVATGALFWSSQLTHNGWFAGGGIEYAPVPNVIVGIEATHAWLGTKLHVPTTPGGAVVFVDRHDVSARFTMIRARLSYLFNLWR